MKRVILAFLLLLISGGLVYNLYPDEKIPPGVIIDRLVVKKSERTLLAYADGKVLKKYRVALGTYSEGQKQCEGDRKTPEGAYYINDKSAVSRFHKNLAISYPNDDDKERCRANGKPPGGDIKIHGLQNGLGWIGRLQRLRDWTAGCIAVTDEEIDELYDHTPVGTAIEITP